ncbi:cytidine deaminase [Candidatus Sumerlaeota bacterium]|nr:cytidine deaminase [Candidatus Sumerlaeota bacterium]
MAKRRRTDVTAGQWTRLTGAARAVRRRAYAPYSGFKVGAALLTHDGQIVSGCNVENVSFGLTICAERGAIMGAVARGKRRFRALVICSGSGVGPCGACRQVLAEFSPQMRVRLVRPRGEDFTESTIAELLPGRFDKSTLSD